MTDAIKTAEFTEVFYIPAAEIGSFASGLPAELYIRGTREDIPVEQITNLKEDLIFRSNDGSVPVVQVIDPMVYYVDAEGTNRWLNGNSRSRAIVEMLNDTKYKTLNFAPVPVRQFLGTVDKNVARRYQVASNDSTNAHTVAQINDAIVADYNQIVEEETTHRGVSKAKSYAIEVLSNAYNLSGVRIGHHLQLATAPIWLKNHVSADNVSFDVALNMVKESSDKGSSTPLETIWHGTQALLSEKETKITAKHFKKFVDTNLRATRDDSLATSTATLSETEEAKVDTTTKVGKPFDVEKAVSDIRSTVISYGTLDLVDLPVDKIGDNLVTTVAAASGVINYLLQKQAINKSTIINTFDTIQTLLFDLLTDDEGEINLPELDEKELQQFFKLTQPLGKQLELLSTIGNGSEDAIQSDDEESEDQESDNDESENEESDDVTLETEEYTLETV